MEEMLVTYQDAIHALSEMEEVLDAVDTEEFSPDAFRHVIETYKEAKQLFLDFVAQYIENITETPLVSNKPIDILSIAHEEKIITNKEYKFLSQQLTNKNLEEAPTQEDAEHLLQTFASLHDTMRDILDEIEI